MKERETKEHKKRETKGCIERDIKTMRAIWRKNSMLLPTKQYINFQGSNNNFYITHGSGQIWGEMGCFKHFEENGLNFVIRF